MNPKLHRDPNPEVLADEGSSDVLDSKLLRAGSRLSVTTVSVIPAVVRLVSRYDGFGSLLTTHFDLPMMMAPFLCASRSRAVSESLRE